MLRVSKLSYSFDQLEVLRDVSFGVATGELFGIMGPSGVGKSTILRLIAGLLEPPRGSIVEVAGEDLRDLPVARRPLSYMQQGFPLYQNLSVFDNLRVGSDRGDDLKPEARRLLECLHLPERIWGERPLFLSGGEAQRVALGKALLKDAKVLMLDEPFSNLDKQTKVNLADLVRHRVKALGRAALVISHAESDLALLADRVGVIERGQFAQVGTLEELWQTPQSIQTASIGSVVGLQFLKRHEMPSSCRDRLPEDVAEVAWRAEASILEPGGRSEDYGCGAYLCFMVRVVRAFRFGGQYLVELTLPCPGQMRLLWHAATANVELDSDAECLLRVPIKELRQIGKQGDLRVLQESVKIS